jgi:hypothetical protein
MRKVIGAFLFFGLAAHAKPLFNPKNLDGWNCRDSRA